MGLKSAYRNWQVRRGERRTFRQISKRFGLSRADAEVLRTDVVAFMEQKGYTPSQLVHAFGGTTKWQPFSQYNAITKGLQKSVFVYACTTLRAVTAASVPFVAKVKRGDDWVAEDGPLQKLLNNPNPEWTWSQFVMNLSYHRDLGGMSYITKHRSERLASATPSQHSDAKGKSTPVALWAHSADAFKINTTDEGTGIVKSYSALRRGLPDLPPEDMMVFRMPRPGDPWLALAPFEAAWTDIQTDTSCADFQKYSMDNRAVLSGILALNELPAATGKEAAKKFKKDFEDQFKGPDKAHGIFVTPARKITFHDIAKTARELDFIKGRKFTRENICAAFGVPPVLVGILDRATYSNFAQAELSFWRFAIIPFLTQLRALLNQQLVPEFGNPAELRIDIDLSGVDALWQLYHERVETAKLLVDAGAPWQQVNDICRLGLREWPGWEGAQTNGRDVASSLVDVMRSIASGEIAPDAAVIIITSSFPTVTPEAAQAMVSAQVAATPANSDEAGSKGLREAA